MKQTPQKSGDSPDYQPLHSMPSSDYRPAGVESTSGNIVTDASSFLVNIKSVEEQKALVDELLPRFKTPNMSAAQ